MPIDLPSDEIQNSSRQELPIPAPRYSLMAKKSPPSYEQATLPSYDKALKNVKKIHRERSLSAPELIRVPKSYEKVVDEKQEERLKLIKKDIKPLELIKKGRSSSNKNKQNI